MPCATRAPAASPSALRAEPTPCGELPARVWLRVQESGLDAHATRRARNGMGLLGMRERVEAQGGELQISAQPGRRPALEAWMPIRAPCAESWPMPEGPPCASC